MDSRCNHRHRFYRCHAEQVIFPVRGGIEDGETSSESQAAAEEKAQAQGERTEKTHQPIDERFQAVGTDPQL